MSDVNPHDSKLINGKDDVAALYSGAGQDAKTGQEIELAFLNPQTPDLKTMSLSQNRVLRNAAQAALPGDWAHNEPTSEVLEAASIPAAFGDLRTVMDDTNAKIAILTEKAKGLGLKRSYFQELPEKTADDLLSRIVDVERYKTMYAPYREDMRECVRYFAVCKSNQVSISYKNPEHALENVRRLYLLAPFLFLLTDNGSGFIEGKAFKGHAGMHLRHKGLREKRGGIMPYVFSAQSGEEYIDHHIAHVFNNPLFMYYDENATLQRVSSGDWGVTFNTLKQRGLNTASNYFLAQSVLWPDVKIAALKDEKGQITGHRYEARMFGVGAHQHQTALIITAALAFHDDFAVRIDDLLLRYGFDPQTPKETLVLLEKSYVAAREHGGKFLSVAYGTGIMCHFAREFGELIGDIADDLGLEEEIEPLLTICRTGCTDGKVNRLLFPTLADVLAFQRDYDPEILETPNMCAKTLLQKEISRISPPQGSTKCCG